jgi:hypothetical protein
MAERGPLELRFLSVPVPVEFNMKHLIAALVVALAVGSASAQNTWFVDVAGQPPGNGTAVFPYTSIQSAIDAPSTLAGDTVQVASGVYMESVHFRGKSLRVIGAGASTTTIDASGRNSAAVLMVSSENSTTVLKGFTIQGGQGNSTSGGYGLGQGGGVLCVGAAPRLEELVIRNNQASHGGGIQLYNGANATIRRCEVYNNYAQPDGGGIYVRGCHSPVIEDSIVRDNSSSTWGGGFYFSDDVDAQISRTLVVRNSSGTGGAFVLQADCDPVLTNVTIADNSAGLGAGLFLYHAGWPPNNPVLLNSIVWNNLPTEVHVWGGSASGSVSAAYTDFRGGIGGVGNLNVDPAFNAPAAGDYTLSVGSPCIDAGDPASPADPDGSRADMGAIPHQVVVQPYCTGKVNSAGCTPAMTWFGTPSAQSSDFHVVCVNVLNNRTGLFYWGLAPTSTPFFGGVRCVAYPVRRTPLQGSGGSPSGIDCTGTWDFHFSASYMQASGVVPGQSIYGQFWGRDPGYAAPANVMLSNAVRFTVQQ